jgi:hypothetical protein
MSEYSFKYKNYTITTIKTHYKICNQKQQTQKNSQILLFFCISLKLKKELKEPHPTSVSTPQISQPFTY